MEKELATDKLENFLNAFTYPRCSNYVWN